MKLSAADTLVVYDAVPVVDDILYELHFGGNLISFPFSGCYDIEQLISSEANEYIDKIVGEGVSAINNPAIGWLGSLDQLCGGQGYWIIVNEAIDFQYLPENQTIRLNKYINK